MIGVGPNPIAQALAAAVVAKRLAKRGDVKQGLALLSQALHLCPEAPLLASAESWFTPDALRAIGPRPLRRLTLILARLATTRPRGAGHDARLSNLRAGVRIIRQGRACYPDDRKLYVGEVFIRSKLGSSESERSLLFEAYRQATLGNASASEEQSQCAQPRGWSC